MNFFKNRTSKSAIVVIILEAVVGILTVVNVITAEQATAIAAILAGMGISITQYYQREAISKNKEVIEEVKEAIK